ncbi:hypothetical protein [Methanosarcina sp.]|nr:hypothetical protein [Methanosarcina sp.]MDD4247938.1 hypothetical protein [Methanosarcina sp.]
MKEGKNSAPIMISKKSIGFSASNRKNFRRNIRRNIRKNIRRNIRRNI